MKGWKVRRSDLDQRARRQARRWFAIMWQPSISNEELDAFHEWLRTPRNKRAYSKLEDAYREQKNRS